MPPISHAYKSPNYDSRQGADIGVIVLHATVGSFVSARDWLCNPQSRASSHYLIGKQGQIAQLVSDEHRAWHAGVSSWNQVADVNDFSISIELENHNDGHDPYTPELMASLTWLVNSLCASYKLQPADIITHAMCALPAGRKTDPANFPLTAFRAALNTPQYTADSYLLGSPLAPSIKFSAAKTAYDPIAVRMITNGYWRQAQAVGIDPILAFAQCLHETARLTSWWCLRPRRNPAGIGVTGETRTTPPIKPACWAHHPDGRWHQGCSYDTWVEDAIPIHLGRLLGYALRPERMNPAQLKSFTAATLQRPLPQSVLGSAPTIKQLGAAHNASGFGWATPGINYGAAIAAIANSIRGNA